MYIFIMNVFVKTEDLVLKRDLILSAFNKRIGEKKNKDRNVFREPDL